MKKIVSFLLSMFLAISMPISILANDSSNMNYEISEVIDTTPVDTEEILYFDTDTGENYIDDSELLKFEDVVIPTRNTDTKARAFEYYIVHAGIKSSKGGQFTWYFNVDCPTSLIKKPNIKVIAQVKGSFTTRSSIYSNVGSTFQHTYTSNKEYSMDYTWTTPAKTGYYSVEYTIIDYDMKQTRVAMTNSVLSNKSGVFWNFVFYDWISGKYLPEPPANYSKGAIAGRVPSLAKKYYNTYKAQTGIDLLSSSYDVHHIRPLAYGGSNDYSNLIHLPKELHKKVTGWWAGY